MRVISLGWLVTVIVAVVVISHLPTPVPRYGLDAMWGVCLIVQIGYAAWLVAERDRVRADPDYATVWVTVMFFVGSVPWLCRSWIALGLGVVLFLYAMVLSHQAKRASSTG